jgi:MoaA/NifB/PqqE/SkfB family radical SAM enzyme
VNLSAAERSYFAFFPHAQLVRGQVGAAVHDLFLARLFWIRDGAAAAALAHVAAGADVDAAAHAAVLPRETLDQYLATLAALDLGTVVPTPTAHQRFRPLFSPMQAQEKGVFRPHGRVTIELSNECVFECPWCTSANALTPLACHCGVWPAEGPRLGAEERATVIARLAEQGMTRIVVRGGEPLLQWDDLLALLRTVSTLHLHCEIHSTGIGLTEDRVAALKEYQAQIVLLFASSDDAEFDRLVRRPGAGAAFRNAVPMLRRAGVSFSAKVPVSIRDGERGAALTEWALASGAERVEQIDYGLACDGCSPAELRARTGPVSPQGMGVDIQDFFANVECQNCFANACCVAADGRLQPCIGARDALADLTREPITRVLREDRMSTARAGTARVDISACGGCEFRYGCQACLVRSRMQASGERGRHWNCGYDPATGVWGNCLGV